MDKLKIAAFVPVIIGGGIAVLILSYLLVPMVVVGSAVLIAWFVVTVMEMSDYADED